MKKELREAIESFKNILIKLRNEAHRFALRSSSNSRLKNLKLKKNN
jgi:excinuclease UvrABC nuclease subunit